MLRRTGLSALLRSRPRNSFSPVVSSVIALGAWAAVARESGSGWVQLLGALLAVVLLLGLLGPLFVLSRLKVSLLHAPSDATSGVRFPVRLKVSSPCELRAVGQLAGGPLRGTGELAMEVASPYRGVLHSLELEVATASPFGLLWWQRRVVIDLPGPLYVAPRVGTIKAGGNWEKGARTTGAGTPTLGSGELRGATPYFPGAPVNQVNWKLSAHAGSLMLSEREEDSGSLALQAMLPADPEKAENAASEILGILVSEISGARSVVLVTREAEGFFVGTVGDVLSAKRRMAKALSWQDLASTSGAAK
jgi:uncharacterized protein (DUF58 family)